jgi:hypothetical protein
VRLFPILCAGTLAMISIPAVAQLEPEKVTGSLVRAQPKAVDRKSAGVIRKGFVQCVYRRARPKVLAFLQHTDAETIDLAGAKITNVQRDLRLTDCLSEEVGYNELALGASLNPKTLRDWLAEEDYLARYRTAPVVSANPQPLDASFISTGGALDRAKSFSTFIDCAILKDLPDSDALLRTMPGSEKEYAAAAALAPALGACLIKGQDFALTPSSIRSFVAFGMWNRFARPMARNGIGGHA